MPTPFFSPIPLPDAVREQGISVVQPVVDSGVALSLVARHAHWNVKGPSFGPLHDLFGELYAAINCVTDVFAERIVTLGGVANGMTVFGASSQLPSMVSLSDGMDLCRALAQIIASYAAQSYAALTTLNDLGLVVDSNVFQDAVAKLEKLGWKIGAHVPDLQSPAPAAAAPAPTT